MREYFQAPRELLLWIDKLNLSYKINNFKRDLSNGFLIAEILSRYLKTKINLDLFYNDYGINKKNNNWEQITILLKEIDIIITKRDYEPIIFLHKNSAFNFIILLYNKLNPNKPINLNSLINTQNKIAEDDNKKRPHYLQNTANFLISNKEVTRIVDNKEKFLTIFEILQNHKKNKRNKLSEIRIKEYIEKKQLKILEMQTSNLFKKKIEEQKRIQSAKSIKLYSNNNKKDKIKNSQISIETKGFIENLSELCKVSNNSLGFKYMDDDLSLDFVIKLFSSPSDLSFFEETIKIYIENINEIAEKANNSCIDFKLMIKLFLTFIENNNTNSEYYFNYYTFLLAISSKLLLINRDFTLTMMESIGLELISEFAIKYSHKREALCDIIYCFTGEEEEQRINIILKLKELLNSNFKIFISIIAHLVSYPITLFSDNLFDIYFYYAKIGIGLSSVYTKVYSIKILSTICKYNVEKIATIFDNINKLANQNWWEIKAQIIILVSNFILNYNNSNLDDSIFNNFTNIIYKLFKTNENINVLKIGIIYFSPVLNILPELSSHYLNILLLIDEPILDIILNNDDEYEAEAPIVLSQISFKYKQTNAQRYWNSLSIAEALNQLVKASDIDILDIKHLKILDACLYLKIDDDVIDHWIRIFNDLKKYIFVGLYYVSMSNICKNIIINFIEYDKIRDIVITENSELFIKIITLIYSNDNDDQVMENIIELFDYICKINEDCKEFIYKIIKSFTENNNKYYLKSNLVPFMNDISKERRDKLYGDLITQTFSF